MSLIEILVSFFIIACMLLGLDAAQLTALHATKSAYYFSIATSQVQMMSERLQLEKYINADFYFAWNKNNAAVLPKGNGVISGSYPYFVITIFWGDHPHQSCEKNQIGIAGCLSQILSL